MSVIKGFVVYEFDLFVVRSLDFKGFRVLIISAGTQNCRRGFDLYRPITIHLFSGF
jgi:hypothetical protein